ncbi:MAG: hypothetical protein JGK27_19835 [Microcoleus sp. PH2017_20_SFW_D_A]|nr:hypothetical protein [Microcoleus sp. PH2017_13_LAR_U_A]MCC3523900.1 hypothetical protein [Microcoleus sp. PH2017_20_SFW_D_A]
MSEKAVGCVAIHNLSKNIDFSSSDTPVLSPAESKQHSFDWVHLAQGKYVCRGEA